MSQVDVQLKANQIKAKVKKMLKNIDEGKTGSVKEDLFYQLLTLHGIDLSKESKTVISNAYKKNEKINYNDALAKIGIDLETAAYNQLNWIVRQPQTTDYASETKSIRSNFMSRAKSIVSQKALLTQTNSRQARYQSLVKDTNTRNQSIHEDSKENLVNLSHQGSRGLLEATSNGESALIRKAHMDYPNYAQKDSTVKEYERFAEDSSPKKFVKDPRKNLSLGTQLTYKTSEIPSYIQGFLEDKEIASQIANIINHLYEKGLDSRQLGFLKLGFVKKDKQSTGKIKLLEFREIFNSIFRGLQREEMNEIFTLILSFIKDKDSEEDVNYEKLNTLVELFQYYPLIVKKDKNKSTNIYYILNANKTPDFNKNLEILQKKDSSTKPLDSLLEFIWVKIQEKYHAVAQAFRFFDVQNRGKISKNDFIFAIENLKIKIASSDVAMVFKYLDKNHDGYINYHEFCGLCEEKRRNIDPFEISELENELQHKYAREQESREEKSLKPQSQEEQWEKMSNASQMYRGFKSQKLKSKTIPKSLNKTSYTFGVTSLPSDNMHHIMTHAFEKDYISLLQKKAQIDKKESEHKVIRKDTKANRLWNEYQQQKRNNQSFDNKYLSSILENDTSQKLPSIKRQSRDIELLNLIRKNQNQNQYANIVKPLSRAFSSDERQNSHSRQPELPGKDYIDNSQQVNKDDKNELLSQYFSAKRSMKQTRV